uniref:Uncharacterized protein n=2 Tax=Phaeomonas parva TaxID=124430 RepID=A0A7S1UDA4_9STRA|mmetsp:Transcript_41758/g.130782  ORF Transcript_41758/g.130782 Transcript_41758/m.130782 type:complete len:243 (+) Transcript_41758:100-828(+)
MVRGARRIAQGQTDSCKVAFDRIGVKSGAFCSSLCGCGDLALALLLPPVAFAQICVRAQLPLFITGKNTFSALRKNSGYHFFIDLLVTLYFLLVLFIVILFLAPGFTSAMSILAGIDWLAIAVVLGAMRTDFRIKYNCPGELGPEESHGGLNALFDLFLCAVPLLQAMALAQMLRHVMPEQRSIEGDGCFAALGDPSRLPPREVAAGDNEVDPAIGTQTNTFDGLHDHPGRPGHFVHPIGNI